MICSPPIKPPNTFTMKKVTALLLSFLLGQIAFGAVYELRTYVTNPGKLDNLNARFRDHTVGLFKKHGIESIGYWGPTACPYTPLTHPTS